MKIFTNILLLTLLFSVTLFGEGETLFDNLRIKSSGGYGGPVVKLSSIKGETAVFTGGRGGWIVNHTFVLGGGGYGLVNNIKGDKIINGKKRRIQVGYGGLLLGYINNSNSLIHYDIFTLIGAGGVEQSDGVIDDDEDTEAFFVIEPEANIVLNVTSFFRLGFGVSYRYIPSFDYNGLSETDLSGVSGQIEFKFGAF